MKKILKTLFTLCVAAIFLPVPALASALEVPATWDEAAALVEDAETLPIELPVYTTQKMNWLSVTEEGIEKDYEIYPYAADGSLIPEAEWREVLPSTGQHLFLLEQKSQKYALFALVIDGDVLGNGKLSIAQLTRLARAVSGIEPLEGVYEQAADLNDSDSVNIADLTILASWLTGNYPRLAGGLAAAIIAN